MNNKQTPLRLAAAGYADRMKQLFELPSQDTLRNILHDAFVEGALWSLKNPILTSDERKLDALHKQRRIS